MLKIPDWSKRNAARLTHIRKNRLGRGLDPMATVALHGYTVDACPSRAVLDLGERIGLRNAEAFLRRIDEYCAARAAQTGEIRVPREHFGRVVLSRGLDPIGRAHGERVYDALIETGIAVKLGDGIGDGTRDVTTPKPVTSRKRRRDVTTEPPVTSPETAQEPSPTPGLAHASAPHASATPAQHARDARASHDPNSSLEAPTGDVTGAVRDEKKIEERPSERAPQAGLPGIPMFRADGAPVVSLDRVRKRDDELRGIEFDAQDVRRAEARRLRMMSSKGPAWFEETDRLIARPRTAKAAGEGRQAAIG